MGSKTRPCFNFCCCCCCLCCNEPREEIPWHHRVNMTLRKGVAVAANGAKTGLKLRRWRGAHFIATTHTTTRGSNNTTTPTSILASSVLYPFPFLSQQITIREGRVVIRRTQANGKAAAAAHDEELGPFYGLEIKEEATHAQT